MTRFRDRLGNMYSSVRMTLTLLRPFSTSSICWRYRAGMLQSTTIRLNGTSVQSRIRCSDSAASENRSRGTTPIVTDFMMALRQKTNRNFVSVQACLEQPSKHHFVAEHPDGEVPRSAPVRLIVRVYVFDAFHGFLD